MLDGHFSILKSLGSFISDSDESTGDPTLKCNYFHVLLVGNDICCPVPCCDYLTNYYPVYKLSFNNETFHKKYKIAKQVYSDRLLKSNT